MNRLRALPLALLLAVAPIAVLLAMSMAEVTSVRYATYDEASVSGALGKGKWLPGALSPTARGIVETHDVDTNEVWFSYTGGAGTLPPSCRWVDAESIHSPRRIGRRDVRSFNDHLADLMQSGGGTYYACHGEEYDYVLAIDPPSGTVIGWSTGR